jgi:hypothetical protein
MDYFFIAALISFGLNITLILYYGFNISFEQFEFKKEYLDKIKEINPAMISIMAFILYLIGILLVLKNSK